MSSSEIIARGLIRLKNNKIILCRLVKADWYFLPGGHIEFGESSVESFLRECNEEMNIQNIQVHDLIGVIENTFSLKGKEHHEINLLLLASLNREEAPKSIESHLEFKAFDISELDSMKIMPPGLKEIIFKSFTDKEFSWRVINEK